MVADIPPFLLYLWGNLFLIIALVIFSLPYRETKAALQARSFALVNALVISALMFFACIDF